MPPKNKNKNPKAQRSKSKSQSSEAPKLQISADNERRLRLLLLNNQRPPPLSAAAPQDVSAASKSQKAKKLRAVYEKLSLEGFNDDQIELALSSLKESATFESALDWLCFNIPGNELPIKFSTGASTSANEDGSIKIISTARDDWVPQERESDEVKENMHGVSIKIKSRQEETSLDLGTSSNKEWIKSYLEQEEEDEEEEQEEDLKPDVPSLMAEYRRARLGALEAKQKRDKNGQSHFGNIIRKLKQELLSLGISEEILTSEMHNDLAVEISLVDKPDILIESKEQESDGSMVDFDEFTGKSEINTDREQESVADDNLVVVKDVEKKEETDELELDNLFSEDFSASDTPLPEISRQEKRTSTPQFDYSYNLGNIDEIWKKGDVRKIPKAVLQKLCQRLGWEPPKYNRIYEKVGKFQYAVSIVRTASGRGKNRKAGGLISIELPNKNEAFASVEDAQNRVASFAIWQLFPTLPLPEILVEPYSSFLSMWLKDQSLTNVGENQDLRRAGFVDSLLDEDYSSLVSSSDVKNVASSDELVGSQLPEVDVDSPKEKLKEIKYSEQIESFSLKKELESKMKLPKYMNMLKARAALPISKLKVHILQQLAENDVIVVCGETGCGKTTQVPQFILDDMIQSGLGALCNIVCTQPRRLAAISVAERVSDERCESSPGSDDSLVGYHVRLDSVRNKKTKLLFCTTGILLRMLAGNKDLSGISHVIVDEVHERTILGDFLLIVLRKLIEKQCSDKRRLKVILMSATVDSKLFSTYFGNCPVIFAEGRTHPVSTFFLEDVYEKLEYSLASDSPAYGSYMTKSGAKPSMHSVDNHRGKKNLVLSSWGDDSLLAEDYVNPCYIPDYYVSYSERTRRNLRSLNEDVIDFDLLEDLICFIDKNYPSGAILIFLPGVAEIEMLVDKLSASFQFGGRSSDWVLPLHSSLAATDQRKVFLSPPQGVRKVIAATDIAETSITIDDVIYVIDTGKHKEMRYNAQKRMSSMVEDWISQANAKQRRGRAGRVKPGMTFCLYTCHRFEKLMHPFQVPEMLRMPLTELCLQIKSLALGDIKSFLLQAIECPREDAISSAIDLLYKVGAFEGNEELSPLGYLLAKLPVDVLIGKMLLYGTIFGCLSPVLSIASFLSYKLPFVYPKDEKHNVERAKLALLSNSLDMPANKSEGDEQSDHLLMVAAYSKWVKIELENGKRAAQQFCRTYFLNSSVMYMIRDMRVQFGSLLADIGLLDLSKLFLADRKRDKLEILFADVSLPFNRYANFSSVIKAIVCAGLYPNVAATFEGLAGSALAGAKAINSNLNVKDQRMWYDGRREVHIHPSSLNHAMKRFQYPFLVFLEKVETSKVFLRDTSIISPYTILLFGGPMVVLHQESLIIIDGWLKLTAPAQTAVLFKELRTMLHAVLKELISKPEMASSVKNEVVNSIVQLLLEEGKVEMG